MPPQNNIKEKRKANNVPQRGSKRFQPPFGYYSNFEGCEYYLLATIL